MSKKATLILLLLIVAVIIIILAVVYYAVLQKKPQPRTDVNELFSTMSVEMNDFISARLSWLKCEPKQYYDNGSEICFICGKGFSCFGYEWSDEEAKSGSREIGMPAPHLTEVDGLTVEAGDFCYQGLASLLGCQPVNNNSLDCGEINLIGDFQGEKLECQRVKIVLKQGASFNDFASHFCSTKGYEAPENVKDMFPGITEDTPIEEIRNMIKEKFPELSTENITKETVQRFKDSLEIFFCGDEGLGLFKDTGLITVIKR